MPKLPKTAKVKLYIHLNKYTHEVDIYSGDMTSLGWLLIGTHEVVVSVPDVSPIDIAIADQEAKIAEMSKRDEKYKQEIKEAFAALDRLRIERETGGDEHA